MAKVCKIQGRLGYPCRQFADDCALTTNCLGQAIFNYSRSKHKQNNRKVNHSPLEEHSMNDEMI